MRVFRLRSAGTFRKNRCDGAYFDTRPTGIAGDRPGIGISIKTDHRIEAPFSESQLHPFVPIAADLDTPAAKHTPIRVIIEKRVALIDLLRFQVMIEALGFQPDFQEFCQILQCAFSIGRTVSAVHMMH